MMDKVGIIINVSEEFRKLWAGPYNSTLQSTFFIVDKREF